MIEFFSFSPRTELTSMKYNKCIFSDQNKSKTKATFNINDNVIYTYKSNGRAYSSEAVIVKQLSNLTYTIDVDGDKRTAHKNQLKSIPQKQFILKNHVNTRSLRNELEHDVVDNDQVSIKRKSSQRTATKPKPKLYQTLRRSSRINKSKYRTVNVKSIVKKKKM